MRTPARGDIGWIQLNPQSGREQRGRRPVICLSPKSYNAKSGMALFCPITSKVKGYPFEVLITSTAGIEGAVLSDQLRSMDWRTREFDYIDKATDTQLEMVLERTKTLLG